MLRVLITYGIFLPGYKVGGPIQSIANICRNLKEEYQFFIICSDADKDGELLKEIVRNTWNDFEQGTASVYYLSGKEQNKRFLFSLIEQVQPDVIFVNGIYVPLYSIYPLSYTKAKRIISVRGMLHVGALTQKSLKKHLFLAGLKFFGFHKGCTYHATDEAEKGFVQKVFGSKRPVYIAQNFPAHIAAALPIVKSTSKLKMVSVAMVSAMKNILLMVEAVKQLDIEVEYDIYGPIKDEDYWNQCLQVMKTIKKPMVVNYKGELLPKEVVPTLQAYHVFVLPSKSENFGHAIYEALASGKPVITSHHTPWNNLEVNKAGFNVSITNPAELKNAIEQAAMMDNEQYATWSKASRQYALASVDIEKTKEDYRKMFGR